jgi:hypothetical protein
LNRIASIFFLLLLAFAGGMGMVHAHDHEEEACHEVSNHFCADSAHLDCSLCDVVIHPNDISHFSEISMLIFGHDSYKSVFNSSLYSLQIKACSDRAPPKKV